MERRLETSRRTTAWVAALVGLVLGLAAPAASAQGSESTRLFEEGRELAKAGRYADACERFAESLALDPAPGTKLNRGDCLERLGEHREAWILFDEAAQAWERTRDDRATYARDRARAAEAKLAKLVITFMEPALRGLEIRIGDARAQAAPEIVDRFDPGTLEVEVTAPGHEPFETTIEARAGKTTRLEVPALVPSKRTSPASPPEAPAPEHELQRRRGRVLLSIGVGSVGVIGLAASIVVGLQAKADYEAVFASGDCAEQPTGPARCNLLGKQRVDDAAGRADLATGIAIAGGALAATAAVLFFTAPRERVHVVPSASATSVGVTVGGSF